MIRHKLICIVILMFTVSAPLSKAQQDNFPVLTGPYLGQKPPGTKPEVFGAGIIDNNERVFAITFSPDGKECFYTQSLKTSTIVTTKELDGVWLAPKAAEFSGEVLDFEPQITPDGTKMIFGSRRPMPNDQKTVGIPQWFVEMTDTGWSDPKPLGSPFADAFCMYVTVADNGNAYFTGGDGIYLSRHVEGDYLPPEKLTDNINHLQYAAHPFIAPDESFILFDAQPQDGNSDLFVSFRSEEKHWSDPVKFNSNFNTPQNEVAPFITRDGKYLFFSRLSPGKGDIYWVDAGIIEELKPDF